MYALAFRLGWLRKSGRAKDAPYTTEFIFGGLGWTAFSFLIGRRRLTTADPWASRLLAVWRGLAVAAFVGFTYLGLTGWGTY